MTITANLNRTDTTPSKRFAYSPTRAIFDTSKKSPQVIVCGSITKTFGPFKNDPEAFQERETKRSEKTECAEGHQEKLRQDDRAIN